MRCGLVVLAAAALSMGACKKGGSNEPGVSAHGLTGAGVSVSGGIAADLRATADRRFITFLTDSMKPRVDGIPPQMLVGVLQALPVNGGAARKLGTGVTNLPGGYLTSADSRWVLYLGGFNAASHSGTLHAADLKDPSSDPVRLDADVTYLLPSPDSTTVAYVKSGVLKVGSLPKGPFREVAGEVTTAQFSPDSAYLAFRRSPSAAGGLGLVKVAGSEPLRKLSDQVGDYTFSPDGKRLAFAVRSTTTPGTFDLFVASVADAKPSKVATGSSGFAFSPDGKWLARTEGSKSVEAVNFVGDVVVGPATGTAGTKVATSVSSTGFGFSPDSTKLAALEKFDFSKGREWGSLVYVDLKDSKPKELAKRVKTFLWAPDSQSLAFQPIDFHQEFGVSANL
ncbi:MAG: TolB family protein, partial [Myxococcaceae bacterium]